MAVRENEGFLVFDSLLMIHSSSQSLMHGPWFLGDIYIASIKPSLWCQGRSFMDVYHNDQTCICLILITDHHLSSMQFRPFVVLLGRAFQPNLPSRVNVRRSECKGCCCRRRPELPPTPIRLSQLIFHIQMSHQ